jgi:hypothetical protein
MTESLIEVEIDVKRNRNLYFAPLDRAVRSRFDWRRVADKHGAELRDLWGEEPIPGQRLTLDITRAEGAIVEPLQDRSEYKKRIEARDQTLPPARQTFPNVQVNEWLYWLKAAVHAGDAHLLRGVLPESVDYTPKRFGDSPSANERLTEALIAVLYSGLNDRQREEVGNLVGRAI